MTKQTKQTMSIRTGLKAGGLQTVNHNGTRVRTGLKAGGLQSINHNGTQARA